MKRAGDPGIAVAEPLQRRSRSTESCYRMSTLRVAEHKVGQIAGKHPDEPRRPKHLGSVSHMVHSIA
jgi:hypothetical protein